MIETINSRRKNGIGIFTHLPVKGWVIDCALRLLEKLSILAPVKESGREGNRLPEIVGLKGGFNHVGLTIHGVTDKATIWSFKRK